MADLLSLPNELIEAIAMKASIDYVKDEDREDDVEVNDNILIFRLTCRAVQMTLRPHFLRAYFASRNLVLDRARLESLKEVEHIQELAKRATSLEIANYTICEPFEATESIKVADLGVHHGSSVCVADRPCSTSLFEYQRIKLLNLHSQPERPEERSRLRLG